MEMLVAWRRAATCCVWFPWLHGSGAPANPCLKNLPHVDLVVGTQKFHRVADYVEELVARKKIGTAAVNAAATMAWRFTILDVDVGEEAGSQSTIRNQQLVPRQATAFVSIMQGCNMHCTSASSRRRVARTQPFHR